MQRRFSDLEYASKKKVARRGEEQTMADLFPAFISALVSSSVTAAVVGVIFVRRQGYPFPPDAEERFKVEFARDLGRSSTNKAARW